ncbi:MAG TPA: hypothetical protein VGD65_13615 [Chryseosolibacter sp.]
MKKFIQYSAMVVLALIALACHKDDAFVKASGDVTFSFSRREIEGGRTNATGTPSSIYINVVDASGAAVLENKKLALLSFGSGYVTEPLKLTVGAYKITSFIVINERNEAIYATPVQGSPKAELVQVPLPISFVVSENNTTELRPEVIEVSSTDSPEKFGYTSFGFDVVQPEKLAVSVKVELTVGDIAYLDVDTKVTVAGFNASNQQQWIQDYAYVGPTANQLEVKKGFHHYEFSINHWGIVDKQIISGEHLIDGASGEVPVTYVLGGARQPKKLSHFINYIERADPAEWGKTYLAPQSKIEYEYRVDGKPSKMKVYGFVDSLNTFVEQRYFVFQYAGTKLSKLTGFHVGHVAPYIEDFYTYLDNGNVSKIQEVNYAGGITAEVNVTYSYTDRLISAAYTFSNGTSFEYEFNYTYKNISKDKTTRFGGLCSTGTYTYDKNINPLAHLGYMDFTFRNYSVNNKIGENVNYVGCAFPTYIPESFQYKYDGEGFPLEQKTIYKSTTFVMVTKYFYQ